MQLIGTPKHTSQCTVLDMNRVRKSDAFGHMRNLGTPFGSDRVNPTQLQYPRTHHVIDSLHAKFATEREVWDVMRALFGQLAHDGKELIGGKSWRYRRVHVIQAQ